MRWRRIVGDDDGQGTITLGWTIRARSPEKVTTQSLAGVLVSGSSMETKADQTSPKQSIGVWMERVGA